MAQGPPIESRYITVGVCAIVLLFFPFPLPLLAELCRLATFDLQSPRPVSPAPFAPLDINMMMMDGFQGASPGER